MNFYGIKKVTLIDFPGKVACTVFTHGCNLRCPFCHNPEIVIQEPNDDNKITELKLFEFLEEREGKIDGVVFTGGEPLIHGTDLLRIIKKLKKMGFSAKVDTNGTFPFQLSHLIDNKVDYIAMDLKSSKDKFEIMSKDQNLYGKTIESLNLLVESDIDYEIRTTVVPGIHDLKEFKKLAKLLKGVDKYVIQNFVANGTIDKKYGKVRSFTRKELKKYKKIAEQYAKNVEVRENI